MPIIAASPPGEQAIDKLNALGYTWDGHYWVPPPDPVNTTAAPVFDKWATVQITLAANGYMVTQPYTAKDIYVFATFEQMVDWICARLELPRQ